MPPLRLVLRGQGAELNAALGGTARLQLAYGALLALGLVL
jgi:1,4-dihydroxy-2-naphthoate octaprenyltransferase